MPGPLVPAYFFVTFSRDWANLIMPLLKTRLPRLFLVALVGFVAVVHSDRVAAEDSAPRFYDHLFTFSNPIFGRFDPVQLRRGLQVYIEICSSCHGLKYVRYRNLADIGMSDERIKKLASGYEVMDGPNDEGEMFWRSATPADAFVSPYANDQAARSANNGALPPDLSLMAKARPDGPSYIYALMTKYQEAPPDVVLAEGMHYNSAFPGGQIAMPRTLYHEIVDFEDAGGDSDYLEIAEDVTAFLTWAAMPELNQRRSLGLKVMAYLGLFTLLLYILYKRTWHRLD